MRWIAIVACVIAGQGCDPLEVCNPYLVTGMVAGVREVSGAKLDSTPTAILTDGGYRETMEVRERDDHHLLEGADERAGTYDIEITASGYQSWKRTGVEVRPDDSGCHVVQVRLDAGMVRLGT